MESQIIWKLCQEDLCIVSRLVGVFSLMAQPTCISNTLMLGSSLYFLSKILLRSWNLLSRAYFRTWFWRSLALHSRHFGVWAIMTASYAGLAIGLPNFFARGNVNFWEIIFILSSSLDTALIRGSLWGLKRLQILFFNELYWWDSTLLRLLTCLAQFHWFKCDNILLKCVFEGFHWLIERLLEADISEVVNFSDFTKVIKQIRDDSRFDISINFADLNFDLELLSLCFRINLLADFNNQIIFQF